MLSYFGAPRSSAGKTRQPKSGVHHGVGKKENAVAAFAVLFIIFLVVLAGWAVWGIFHPQEAAMSGVRWQYRDPEKVRLSPGGVAMLRFKLVLGLISCVGLIAIFAAGFRQNFGETGTGGGADSPEPLPSFSQLTGPPSWYSSGPP
jgi:hypothetical protein